MSLSVAGIVSVVIFLVVGYSCYRNGLFSTLVTLFIIVLSSVLAVTLLVPLMRIPLFARMGWYTAPICLMGTFLLSLVIMQTVANYLYPPRLVMPKRVDVVFGALLGLVSAYFLTGFLMVAFALFPGTGEAAEKVVFLNADVFFARTMAWTSRWCGSVAFDADAFLTDIRQEKYVMTVKERSDRDIYQENASCADRLRVLGRALEKYWETYRRYPNKLEDLEEFMPGKHAEKQREEMYVCPATELRYRLFPVDSYARVQGDPRYVLIYDDERVPVKYGHLGDGEGKRPALCADGRVWWFSADVLDALLDAQRKAKKPAG